VNRDALDWLSPIRGCATFTAFKPDLMQ
jgi:hypothetical protein